MHKKIPKVNNIYLKFKKVWNKSDRIKQKRPNQTYGKLICRSFNATAKEKLNLKTGLSGGMAIGAK